MSKSAWLGEILNIAVKFCRDYEKGVVQPFIIGYAGSDCKSFSVDHYVGQYGEGYRVHFPNTTSRNCHTVCYFIRDLGYRVHTVLCPISSHDYWERVSHATQIGSMLDVDIKFIEHGSECSYKSDTGKVLYLGLASIMCLDNIQPNLGWLFLGNKEIFSSRYDVLKHTMCRLNKGEKTDEC